MLPLLQTIHKLNLENFRKVVKSFSLFSFLLLMILSISTTSCSNKSDSEKVETKKLEIPALLTRNEKIRMGKEWDDVASNYQKLKLAIEKNDHDNESKIRLAQLFIREARVTGEHGHYYPAAIMVSQSVLDDTKVEDNMKFLAMVTKASVQLSHHDFSGALATGKEAELLNDHNAQLYGVLTDANVELGNYSEAVTMSDKMINIKPDLRAYARISYIREIHGDVPGSIEAMKLAVSAGVPGSDDAAWAMLTLGNMYKMYGYTKEAKQMYEEILVARANYPFAIAELGALKMDAKDYSAAEKLTKEAIDIIPEVGFYTQLADIYKFQGINKSAPQKYESLIEEIFVMLEDDTQSGHNMNLEYAHVYLDLLNDAGKAKTYAMKEYQLRPKNIDVNRMLAKISKSLNESDAQQGYYAIAISTKSKHPDLKDIAN